MSRLLPARTRLIAALVGAIGTAFGLVIAGRITFAPLAAWDVAVLIYIGSLSLAIWPMSASQTKTHASMEDPGRGLADGVLLTASLVSLVAVGIIIIQASNATGLEKGFEVGLALLSVIASWAAVHTTYALRYSDLYYRRPEGGIDFHESSAPRYTDFYYLAFTIGMTFQVSDTELTTKDVRKTALKHAMLSYLFGTVIIATTINTIASLGK